MSHGADVAHWINGASILPCAFTQSLRWLSHATRSCHLLRPKNSRSQSGFLSHPHIWLLSKSDSILTVHPGSGPSLTCCLHGGHICHLQRGPCRSPRVLPTSPCESSAPRQFIGPRTAQPLTCCLGFTPHSLLAPLPPWPRPAGHTPLSSCRLPGHFASDLAWAPQPYIPGWALAVYSARKVLPQRPAHPPNCFSLRSTGSPDHSS